MKLIFENFSRNADNGKVIAIAKHPTGGAPVMIEGRDLGGLHAAALAKAKELQDGIDPISVELRPPADYFRF